MGFGAGKGSSKTKVSLIDTTANKNVTNFEVEGSIRIGAFGGDAKGMLDETAEEIYKQVKENFIIK